MLFFLKKQSKPWNSLPEDTYKMYQLPPPPTEIERAFKIIKLINESYKDKEIVKNLWKVLKDHCESQIKKYESEIKAQQIEQG